MANRALQNGGAGFPLLLAAPSGTGGAQGVADLDREGRERERESFTLVTFYLCTCYVSGVQAGSARGLRRPTDSVLRHGTSEEGLQHRGRMHVRKPRLS